MDSRHFQLSDATMAAANRGDLIEAIKITRADTHLGLKEAKDLVDAYVSNTESVLPSTQSGNPAMPAEAVQELASNNVIEAIKIVRTKTGLGLKEAKDFVDAYVDLQAVTASRSNTIVKGEAGIGKPLLISFLVAAVITATLWITGVI